MPGWLAVNMNFSSVQHLGLKALVVADHGMRNVISIVQVIWVPAFTVSVAG